MTIVYVSYGPVHFHVQARLSILSALRYCQTSNIVVVTDSAKSFADLSVRVVPLSAAQIAEFSGPMKFVFRVKIKALLYFSSQDAGPFVFVDTDTYWLKDPMELTSRLQGPHCLMESLDGIVSETHFRRLHRFLMKNPRRLAKAGYSGIRREMYVSGLIGFPALENREALLQRAVDLIDFLMLHAPEVGGWLEQYALGTVLAEEQGVQTAEGFTHHYWNCSTEIQILLAKLSAAQLADLAASRARFDSLLADAFALKKDPAHRKFMKKRKYLGSFRKRLAVIRAFFLRSLRWVSSATNKQE